MHRLDYQFEALGVQGFTGANEDRLLQWLQANGASSPATEDAWREMLDAQGYSSLPHNYDAWYQLLGDRGYTGAMEDRELGFWRDGGILADILIVIARGPYTGGVNTAIQLDGIVIPSSTDPNPTIAWSIVSGGAGVFADASDPKTTFTPSAIGPYVLQLSADPSDGPPVTDTADLTSNAVAPTVEAGGPYSGTVETAIPLSGASVTPGSDPSPTTLWTIVSGGAGSFSPDANTVNASFTPSVAGPYVLRLSADPSDGPAVTDDANLQSNAVVTPPTVDAGGPYSGNWNTAIQLNGTITPGSDPSPAILWTADQPGTFLPSATVEDPTFTPTTVGTVNLTLTVTPNDGPPVQDGAVLTSNAVAPTVDAGGPYSGQVSTPIQLDSTVTPGSDPSPTLAWSIVSGGTGTFLPNNTVADPTFTPDATGAYVLRLTVSTTDSADVTDDANLTSSAVVTPPTVEAGGPYSGDWNTAIALSGASVVPGSDLNPAILWTVEAGSAGGGVFLPDANQIKPTFTPDAAGAYTLKLEANPSDGPPVSDTASLTSNVVAPTVDAGGPYSGTVSTPIPLSGTVNAGSAPNPTLLWTIVSGGTGTFSNNAIVNPTFTPDAEGAYVLRLSADPADGPAVTDDANLTSQAASGTVLIQDSFTGPDDTAVIGRLPDVVNQGVAWGRAQIALDDPDIQGNELRTGNTRNAMMIDPGVADHYIEVKVVNLNRGSATRVQLGVRNTSTSNEPSWQCRGFLNNNADPRIEIAEDNTTRATATFPDDFQEGTLSITSIGSTLTGRWVSPGAGIDESVAYALAGDVTVTECTLGTNGNLNCRMDDYKIEDRT